MSSKVFVIRGKTSGQYAASDGSLVDLPKSLREVERKSKRGKDYVIPRIFNTAWDAFSWHFAASVGEAARSGIHPNDYDFETVELRFDDDSERTVVVVGVVKT